MHTGFFDMSDVPKDPRIQMCYLYMAGSDCLAAFYVLMSLHAPELPHLAHSYHHHHHHKLAKEPPALPSPVLSPPSKALLFHRHLPPQRLKILDQLLRLLLRHALLQHLGRTLSKLLAVHQTEAEHRLDLLDDLGFRGWLKGL
jgi:hypothetical protein